MLCESLCVCRSYGLNNGSVRDEVTMDLDLVSSAIEGEDTAMLCKVNVVFDEFRVVENAAAVKCHFKDVRKAP